VENKRIYEQKGYAELHLSQAATENIIRIYIKSKLMRRRLRISVSDTIVPFTGEV